MEKRKTRLRSFLPRAGHVEELYASLMFAYNNSNVSFSLMDQLTNCSNMGNVAERLRLKSSVMVTNVLGCRVYNLATAELIKSHAVSAPADDGM